MSATCCMHFAALKANNNHTVQCRPSYPRDPDVRTLIQLIQLFNFDFCLATCTMAGGKPEDSFRQWQVNSDAGTLQGWGTTSATPAVTESVEVVETQPTTCLAENTGASESEDDTDIDPQKLQARH